MTTLAVLFWCGLLLVGFVGSALYSGLETGAYRLNRVRLHNRVHQGRSDAKLLADLTAKPTVLLSTLLIGNNLTNNLGTASLTVLFESGLHMNQWQNVLANVLIVTPLLFVFGETLPKDLFGAYADRLMYRLAPVLRISRIVFTYTGMVPLVSVFTGVMFRIMGEKRATAAFHPRSQVEQLVKEGVGHGLLSAEQSAIVDRVLAMGDLTIRKEMIPWEDVTVLAATVDPEAIWDLAGRTSRSRFPVVDEQGKVIGVLHILDALMHTPQTCPPLSELITAPFTIDAATPLRQALRQLQTSRAALAIVTEKGEAVGIASIKDLVEPITGELVSW